MVIFAVLFILMALKIASKIHSVLTKSLTELKKEKYNMNMVNSIRRRIPSLVRKDERHLYQ